MISEDIVSSFVMTASLPSRGSTAPPLIKVVKGEIHNVLSVMRADPRYASPLRFALEDRSNVRSDHAAAAGGGGGGNPAMSSSSLYDGGGHNANTYYYQGSGEDASSVESLNGPSSIGVGGHMASSSSLSQHPLLASLRDLNDHLTHLEAQSYHAASKSAGHSSRRGSHRYGDDHLDTMTYLSPFATAVSSRDISAPITGAALSSLTKFLLYGFITPSTTGGQDAITVIARCVRHCTFEDTSGSGQRFSGRNTPSSAAGGGAGTGQKGASGSNSSSGRRRNNNSTSYLASATDEEVVLKLLSLASLTVRCPAGALLDPIDVVGIFDTCLHVAHRAGSASALLRSAAGDALAHVVLVVFGRASSATPPTTGAMERNVHGQGIAGDDVHDDDDDSRLSDDLWCEADPADGPLTDDAFPSQSKIPVINEDAKDDNGPDSAVEQKQTKKQDAKGPTQENSTDTADAPPPPPPASTPGGSMPLTPKPSLASLSSSVSNARPYHHSNSSTNGNSTIIIDATAAPPPVTIMSRLAALVNPAANPDATCALALSLVNIALETAADGSRLTRHPQLIAVMQDALCRHLLQLSTTSDLVILSLTLRVIFNLFNSIKDHLKVQLEVFLTSVHLRILDPGNDSSTPERREVALESLLEFCHEPALMQDLYVNYDCDVHCTNLFETICRALAKGADPDAYSLTSSSGPSWGSVMLGSVHGTSMHGGAAGNGPIPSSSVHSGGSVGSHGLGQHNNGVVPSSMPAVRPLNVLNRLAAEGILAVIDSIARRCRVRGGAYGRPPGRTVSSNTDSDDASHASEWTDSVWSTNTTTLESDAESESPTSPADEGIDVNHQHNADEWIQRARAKTSEVLIERKRRKHRLAVVAREFNRRPMGKEWLSSAERLGILTSPPSAPSVASFLFSTPKLDKTQIGLYLSKGPKEKYPFHAEVLTFFVAMFDFSGMDFSDALRSFLLKFRLPGEAQCIDRLMEAFAARLYEQRGGQNSETTAEEMAGNKTDEMTLKDGNKEMTLDGRLNEDAGDVPAPPLPFRSADAAFVLAFSTIMLNTDLHNPTIKDERRMTLEQFIRNNRGINDGEDLPPDFLSELYERIKADEIQVQKDVIDVVVDGVGGDDAGGQWDGILSKSNTVAEPVFTPSDAARRGTVTPAGVHEKDMFASIAPCCLECLSTVFTRSWDDALVIKALKAFKQMAKICLYFSLDEMYNEILEIMLGYGREYVVSTVALAYADFDPGEPDSKEDENADDGADGDEPNNDDDLPIPTGMLSDRRGGVIAEHPASNDAMEGSAEHRGLLSLDVAFTLVRTQTHLIREAWPILIECVFSLRDANALPVGLSDLDDFADSQGIPLPRSYFAVKCHNRAQQYFISMSTQEEETDAGFWGAVTSIFGNNKKKKKQSRAPIDEVDEETDHDDVGDVTGTDENASSTAINALRSPNFCPQVLLTVSESAQLEDVLIRTKDQPLAIQTRILRVLLDAMDPFGSRSISDESGVGDMDDDDNGNSNFSDPLFESHAVFALEIAARGLLFNSIDNRHRAAELFPMFLSKFEAVLSLRDTAKEDQNDIRKIKNPYLMERVVVTILRSCIHLYDVPEMRPYLKTSLLLLFGLPTSFVRQISNRLACGMAIILRGNYNKLEAADEWSLVGHLLDTAASYAPGRGFVFDGVASCVDHALPDPPYPTTTPDNGTKDDATQKVDGENNSDAGLAVTPEETGVTYEGASTFARMLLKFVFGSYEGDISMCVPAMLCLEKVYWYLVYIATDHSARTMYVDGNNRKNQNNDAIVAPVPDEELWQSVVTACYGVCLLEDEGTAQQGVACLQRILLTAKAASVSDSTWLSILDAMSTRQPLIYLDDVRAKVCSLLGKILLVVVPELSRRKENWDSLTDVVNRTAFIAAENLKAGRQGKVSVMFESTVQTITNLANVMSMPEFDKGGEGFCQWCGDTLLAELEKVGASGGSSSMIAATTRPEPATQAEKPEEDET